MIYTLIQTESCAQAVYSGENRRSQDGESGSIAIAKLFRFPISIVIRASLPDSGIPAGKLYPDP